MLLMKNPQDLLVDVMLLENFFFFFNLEHLNLNQDFLSAMCAELTVRASILSDSSSKGKYFFRLIFQFSFAKVEDQMMGFYP